MKTVTNRLSRRLRRPRFGHTVTGIAALFAAVLGLLLASAMPAMANGGNCPPKGSGGSSNQSSYSHSGGSSARGTDGARGVDGARGTNGADSIGGFTGSSGGNGFGGLGSLGGFDAAKWIQGSGASGAMGSIGSAVDIANLSVTADAFGKHDCEITETHHDKDLWRFGVSAGSIISINARFADAKGGIHAVKTETGGAAGSANAAVSISTDKLGLKFVGGTAVVAGAQAGVTVNLLSTCPAKGDEESKPVQVTTTPHPIQTAQPKTTGVAAEKALPVTGTSLTLYLVIAAVMIALGVGFVLTTRRRARQSLMY